MGDFGSSCPLWTQAWGCPVTAPPTPGLGHFPSHTPLGADRYEYYLKLQVCGIRSVLQQPKAVSIVSVPMLLTGKQRHRDVKLLTRAAQQGSSAARVAASGQPLLALPGVEPPHSLAYFLLVC